MVTVVIMKTAEEKKLQTQRHCLLKTVRFGFNQH